MQPGSVTDDLVKKKKKERNPRTRLGYRSNALHTPVIWEKGEEGGGEQKKKKARIVI